MDSPRDEYGRGFSPTVSAKTKSKRSLNKSSSSRIGGKKRSNMTTTGAGNDKNEASPPNNTKKIILGSGILLAIISTVAIVLVLNGNIGSKSNKSIKQFSMDLQMEKVDGRYIKWSNDYQDLSSEKSMRVIQKLSAKLTESFKEEGIIIDEVVVDEIIPSEPKSFTTTHPVDKTILETPQISDPGDITQFMRDDFVQDFSKVPVETVQHTGVQHLTAKSTTMATPAKNAAVFMASNGRWPAVANVLESRMAAKGMGVSIGSVTVDETFMNTVQKAVEENPDLANAKPSPNPPGASCNCQTDGRKLEGPEVLCTCKSTCIDSQNKVYGGKDDEFADNTLVCVAAYYAGVITEDGGHIHVIKVLDGNSTEGGNKQGIESLPMKFETGRYRVKAMGTVIRPPLAPPPTAVDVHFSTSVLFNIAVAVQTTNDFKAVKYSPEMADLKSPQTQEFVEQAKKEILKATTAYGITEISLLPTATADYTNKSGGIIIAFEALGDNVQSVYDVEKENPGLVKKLIDDQLLKMWLVNFRYSKECIEKMNELRKKDAS